MDIQNPDLPERVTPMMAQYIEIKAANPDCLLFYRMGDFYELFFGDAEAASRTLGIMLTKRGKHAGVDIPMCGVPVDRADDYLQRLISAGYRVAVCEQLEDPAEAKKRGNKSVVRRDVVRLVTPGTLTEDNLLEPGRANLLCSVARIKISENEFSYAIAAVDISTGSFNVCSCMEANLLSELARLEPSELVMSDALHQLPDLRDIWAECRAAITPFGLDAFDSSSASQRLQNHFGLATLDGIASFTRAELSAAASVLSYIERTQLGTRPRILPPKRDNIASFMQIDAATRANLELTRTLSGERVGSLLSTIDTTITPAGGRLLAERLAAPLTDAPAIHERLDDIAHLVDRAELRADLRRNLRQVPDIARAITRLSMGRGGPRDLASIANGLRAASEIALMLNAHMDLPASLSGALETLQTLDATLEAQLSVALQNELPLKARDGGFIQTGFNPELDAIKTLRDNSRKIIASMQADYASQAECRTLRIKHNNFLGYYIEVPQEAGERFLREPLNALFIHRQTMAGAMRFSSVDLAELQTKIDSAAEQVMTLELEIFEQLVAGILRHSDALNEATAALACLDVSASLAEIAVNRNWVKPEITEGLDFDLKAARHVVVEAALRKKGTSFIANDCDLSHANYGRILLVTGPNMAGKSTFLRQNALIAVLAQMGSFVPASYAKIGIIDRLFSRVGAADDLARGRSTFMVEMVETAAILNQATARSLVILDEIGRGTATFDGLSIAWATVENLHDVNGSRALFATHYHELTSLSERLNRLSNITMKVKEWHGDVIFLHEVVAGAADRSYGIQVAKLAGLPQAVVDRAKHILSELESQEREKPVQKLIDELPLFSHVAYAPEPLQDDGLRDALNAINPDDLTPKQALEALYKLKSM
jgi:DNA mismatch repair protein MutS